MVSRQFPRMMAKFTGCGQEEIVGDVENVIERMTVSVC